MAEYTTERRRAARAKVPMAIKRAAGKKGGKRRMALASAAERTAMAHAGNAGRMAKVSPERRREIARIGAAAANAARTKAQHSRWSKKGGAPSHRKRVDPWAAWPQEANRG
ncbi:MAG TPA: hypothetical protein VI229_00125 [Burkholderiales bacterium]